ncbi:methyl-accepting chemotaxis protein [Pleomorphomonas sp. JP5]|uniref:methyl-accepting chemotaxis protein n=1 Tax=Pleomorphomonas sp. JP5 TaxID=2942998 RepID=UPI002042CDA9|nr:HAMP domain-containing methyl-accepting chemotaxis protein [Pleomorphomonas sp. JP5]MCM5556661.1 methyl-accepting chemotaxis protein [Pleomorphomonas sp. JP5]
MARLFNNLSIGSKVFVAFALVIALLITCAGLSLFSLSSFERSFGQHRDRVDEVELTRDIDYAFLNLTAQVDAYLTRGSETALSNTKTAAETARASIANAVGKIDDGVRKDNMTAIATLFDGYNAVLTKLIELKASQQKIVRESVEPLGEKLKNDMLFFSSKVDRLGKTDIIPIATKATEQYNAGRLAVYKLLNNGTADDLKAADAGFNGLVQRLNLVIKAVGAGQEAAQLGKVLKSATTFQEAYRQANQISGDLRNLTSKDLLNASTAIADKVAAVRAAASVESTSIGVATTGLIDTIRRMLLVVAGVSVVGAVVLAFVIGRSISRPVVAISRAMEKVSDGDLQTEVPGRGRKDEVGAMADALEVFKTSLAQAAEARAAREADEAAQAEVRRAEVHQLADMFEQTVGGIASSLAAAAGQLNGSAQTLSQSSTDVTQKASTVAAASEAASAGVGTVAAAAEELASSIAEIGRQVNESTEVASKAVQDASETAGKVRELSEAARKIGAVVDLINTIAGQTNLLALNATIEAARAGEAGKGFAVVAAEVKQLADQTAKATSEIGAQVAAIQASTADSSDAIMRITETIGHISKVSNTVAGSVRDQGMATQEIADSVQKAAEGTSTVASNIVKVGEAAGDSSAAAQEVLQASGALSAQAERLQGELRRFLATIRAA